MQIVFKLITAGERESSKSNSSQGPRASGKPDALFSSRSDEPGNQFENSVFKYADPKLRRSLLEGDKDHMLSQTRSDLMKQEQVGCLNRCIKELQQQAYARGLELQNAHQGYVQFRREQGSTTRRIINEGKTSPRYSNTKNSTTTFELLVLMIPFLMTPIYLQLL